jgi:aminoglycoside phosphotransferase (APT) family kinase protein
MYVMLSSPRVRVRVRLDDVLADGAALDIPLPMPYSALRQRLRTWSHVLTDVTTPRLVHWDLWDGNIFIDPASKQITGIIDFERALWGDPLMEFQFRTLAAPPDFAAGYRRPMLETPRAAAPDPL